MKTDSKMAEIKKELQTLCKLFKIGTLKSWANTKENVAGCEKIIFNTDKKDGFIYWNKPKLII